MMMASNQTQKAPNIVICQRYRTYHDWKPSGNFQHRMLPYNSPAIPGENSPPVSVAVRTYLGTKTVGSITRYWAQVNCPETYAFGNGFVVDPEASWPMQVDCSVGQPGEIDLLVGLVVEDGSFAETARNLVGYLTYFTAFLAHDLFGEMAQPLGQPQISWHSEGTTALNSSLGKTPVFKVSHRSLEDDQIQAVFDKVSRSTAPILVSPRVMELALKRYLSSQTESDPVDAFCDLWECLEFLSPKANSIKGTIESRIGYYLAQHSGLEKGKIESEWLRPLYKIRKDIVHNADENTELIERSLHRISAIARAMIRHHLGIPYKADKAILPDSTPNRLWIKMNIEINPA